MDPHAGCWHGTPRDLPKAAATPVKVAHAVVHGYAEHNDAVIESLRAYSSEAGSCSHICSRS